MTDTPSPNLTELVERKLLSVIKSQEAESHENQTELVAENYIKLADLYHFHKSFKKEFEILNRFAEFPTACQEELQDVYERIEKIQKTRHRLQDSLIEKALEKEDKELSLMAIESEPDIVELDSKAKVNLTLISPQAENQLSTIKFLTLCAAYTGKKDTDEIVQLAMVLCEYNADESPAFHVLKTFLGTRNPNIKVPERVFSKFNIKQDDHLKNPFLAEEVIELFEEADYVISHNNPNIERQHLVTLIPEIANAQWYSSQKDIPWRALGFESVSLSSIVGEFGKRKPRSTLERAKAIYTILQHEEPSGGNLFFERIRNMKPMKAIAITDRMKKLHRKMTSKKSNTPTIVSLVFIGLVAVVVALEYLEVLSIW
jgi:hypothetical protein